MLSSSTHSVIDEFLESIGTITPSILMLDYDGTLAPFQQQRDHAFPYPGVLPLLQRIVALGKTRVLVVTGRPVATAKQLLHPLADFEIWGSHGLERSLPDGAYHQLPIPPEAARVLADAKEWATSHGLTSNLELKPGGVALHWRGLSAEEVDEIDAHVRDRWTSLAGTPGMKLLEFDGGMELRVAHPNKGDAVDAVLKEIHGEARLAYLGDDLTDEDAFAVLNGRGLTVLVRPEYRKTAAQAWLRPPGEVLEFLKRWLAQIAP